MNTPFFSIITPLCKNVHAIEETLTSLRQQTINDWECLLIDDFLPDPTREKIKNIIEGDDRFSYYKNLKSAGANVCRNIGINNSHGKYLIFLDPNDLLANHCLEKRRNFLGGLTNANLLISPTLLFEDAIINKRGSIHYKNISSSYHGLIRAFIQQRQLWTISGVTWERSFLTAIGGWNESYLGLEDIELNVRALINHPLIHFTKHEDNFNSIHEFNLEKQSEIYIGLNQFLREYYQKMMEITNDPGEKEKYSNVFKSLIYIIINYAVASKNVVSQSWNVFFLETLENIIEETDRKEIEDILFPDSFNRL